MTSRGGVRVGLMAQTSKTGLADPGEVEDSDQLGIVIDMECQQAPPGAEHGPTICRIVAGRHYNCVPGFLHQFHHSVWQRVESLAGQAAELD